MIIYGLKTCDTCRKARRALPSAAFADVRDDGVPSAVLQRAIARFGDALINRRSTTWRELSEAERALPVEALISAHPTVMKRPLIDDGEGLHLGWDPQTKAALGV
ncbi:arsenate reductase [Poseidonocella pacifica]|uniref:Arsenate reductase n=1 Tax=Poseidonocella pacifica TaxID=871651 RepID=A0A1I0VUP4_9RHOB|nr:ArsC/Spx/MgsR family protein [Poseidonocella pacifica]SFA79908.1 arsenate reductase [Poseidonocella pacifica]